MYALKVAKERLGQWPVRRAAVGSGASDVMRRCVQPSVALHLLLGTIDTQLVEAENDLGQLQGIGDFAQTPAAALRDNQTFRKGTSTHEK